MSLEINTAGLDWLRIKSWIAEELANSISRLKGQQEEASTQFERGQIAAFERLIEAAEPTFTPEVEEENYG